MKAKSGFDLHQGRDFMDKIPPYILILYIQYDYVNKKSYLGTQKSYLGTQKSYLNLI